MSKDSSLADLLPHVQAHLRESIRVKEAFLEGQSQAIVAMGQAMAAAFAAGRTLLIAGNGGSAADAQHMATELVVRLSSSFEREALPAISLSTDSSLITACANDYGYDRIFSRQVDAIGRSGDVFLGITTSGNSENIIRAVNIAKKKGLLTAILTGNTGGQIHGAADFEVLVPSDVTAHIQECHITAAHILCDIIERCYCGKGC
jgi:D-sedoheptulose 7-phosphate isomerase